MVRISIEEAKEWLDKIKPGDYVAVIHDADTDGFTSGLLYYHWCRQKGADLKHYAYERGEGKIREMDLTDCNKIIITDVGPNMVVGDLHTIKDLDVLYIDHHVGIKGVPKEIKEYRTPEGKYFPCARVAYELTNIMPWLGLTGTLGDAGDKYAENEDFLNELTEMFSTTNDEFRERITDRLNNAIIYFEKEGKLDVLFKKLISLKGPEDIKEIAEFSEPVQKEFERCKAEYFNKKEDLAGITYYYFEPKFNIKGALATHLTLKGNIGPAIFATPTNGGDFVGFSSRDQSRKINMAKVLKAGCEGLKDSNSGGHPFAAGGRIHAQDLEKFKENVKNYLESTKN